MAGIHRDGFRWRPPVLPCYGCARLTDWLGTGEGVCMKLKELAERLECRLEGEPGVEIHGVAGIEQAGPGEVTFLVNRRDAPNLKTTRASAVFVEDGVEVEREPDAAALAKLRTGDPYLSFAKAIELVYEAPKSGPGIQATAMIAKT